MKNEFELSAFGSNCPRSALGGGSTIVRTNFVLAFLVRYRGDGSRWFGSKLCPDVRRGAPS